MIETIYGKQSTRSSGFQQCCFAVPVLHGSRKIPLRRLLSDAACISVILISSMVFLKHHPRGVAPLFGRLLACGCIALVLLLGILAASPTLHEWLHNDAANPDHECGITLFQHSADAAATTITLLAVAWVFVALAAIKPIRLELAPVCHRLPQGNAPPALN
jgi:hypothetical protein